MDRLVTTTFLEMKSPSQVVPLEGERRLEIRRAEVPCPELNRFLYVAVGGPWWWYSRLVWSREQWRAWVERPEVETWLGYRSGTPVGYFELESQPGSQVELSYFGLLPSFIGLGFGPELLSAAIERAWRLGPERVWVHSCTLDHPRALATYRARGFEIYKVEDKIEQLPDVQPRFFPEGD